MQSLKNFTSGKLFIEFTNSFNVPSIEYFKRKNADEKSEKMYPFFNNKLRIFFIYFA